MPFRLDPWIHSEQNLIAISFSAIKNFTSVGKVGKKRTKKGTLLNNISN